MKIIEIIASRRWRNSQTGATASICGSAPYTSESDKRNWAIETIGFTWRLSNGTIGLGRTPAKTREEAEQVMRAFNEREERESK